MRPPKVMKKMETAISPLQFYRRTKDAWEAMYADCAAAQQSIEFEQYILGNDEVGRRFLSLFGDKLKQGVTVRLMLDSVGSRDLIMSSALESFRKAGGVVHFYNLIGLGHVFTPKRWFPRNHNKIMLIDGRICYIGSVCISAEMADWQDMHVRLDGILTDEIALDFSRLWSLPEGSLALSSPAGTLSDGNFSYVVSQQNLRPNLIYRHLLREIGRARHSICIVTPYFLPPWLLRRALKEARRRGVEVRVMVSARTDVAIADCVSRSYYPALFRHGVRIFHFTPTVLHAKYMIVDDDWATIGSANVDYLSLLRNREANVIFRDRAVVAEIQAHFDDCIGQCREVNIDYYLDLPFIVKFFGRLGRSMRRIL